ncbi:P2X purinoceptor 7 isoform X1 [Betta splendens]|uniref:P2X purinoceptor 7 isoform X1 n=1 Tax=Betta splendens TaxID=158456 RepID=A0A9W2XD57_BETSP|nr:P2X purinoceptor 7 isoform X1 [Betta splendens]
MASWSGSIVRPYIYDPESDPDAQEEAVEVTTFRMIQDVSQWYQCGKCQSMPTEAENCCCQEIAQVQRRLNQLPNPPSCMVDHPGLEPVCLNVYSLQKEFHIYRADYGRLPVRGINQRYRFLSYRSFVSWCWGFLGRRVRVVIPSCVVLRIRAEFPDGQGNYVGFRPPVE